MTGRKTFRVVLIKPSHYDDDGYVIQWLRSTIPSNSMASVYGLTRQCAERRVLGDEVDFEITAYDETNTVLPIKRIIRDLKRAHSGFVGLVGVQSNQFPRALDIARQFRAADLPVVIGGFHVGGCLSMLPELPPDIRAAQEMGISLYAGEAEGRLDVLLRDVYEGNLKPLYNYLSDLPDMADAAVPFLPEKVVARAAGHYTSFDSGRGCPFQCSFCTIINVQGRKSRYRTPDDIEAIIRSNAAQGINRFFITDDNFARNKNWEAILDRMIELREREGFRFRFIIQVDTLCHRTPGFIEKAARAGCNRAFIGLESINPDALMGAKKRQNKIWEYRKMLQAWKDAGIITYVGYILGFPPDTPESIERDIEIIKRELPLDMVEFFFLTPLPGSEDHRNLHMKGVWMDPDMNKYDLNHVTTGHANMSKEQWQEVSRRAWKQYYTPEHIETILRRGAAKGIKLKKLFLPLGGFCGAVTFEKVHPLEAGIFRRKVWSQRRSSLPRENPLTFFPRRIWETLFTHARWGLLYLQYSGLAKRIDADPTKRDYMDTALSPVTETAEDELELMKVHQAAIPDTYGKPETGKPRTEKPKEHVAAE
ncbi:MAG: radical SAM protein [Kiloniellales bacterium]